MEISRLSHRACAIFLINALLRYFSTSLYIASICTISNHAAKRHEKWVIDPAKNNT
jgi:hypothetical protein